MSDNNTTPGAGGGANPSVSQGAGATPPSATAGSAGGPGSTRPYTDPYAASVTGADTSRFGGGSQEGGSRREQAQSVYEDSARWARDRYDRGADWVSETYDEASRSSRRGYRRARDGAAEFIEENPLMIGVMGLAAGLLIGALLPISRREHEQFGPLRDSLRDQGYRYGRDYVQRARHIAEEGYRAGYEEAKKHGLTPSQMADTARDVGRAARGGATDTAEKEFGEHGSGSSRSGQTGSGQSSSGQSASGQSSSGQSGSGQSGSGQSTSGQSGSR